MFIAIDYNYNTNEWSAEKTDYSTWNFWYNKTSYFAQNDIRDRLVYVGF